MAEQLKRDPSDLTGRVIAIEGLDGAGKSTVISVLAEHLRQSGRAVFLPRSGKEHSSRPTRMIRRLTRDRRNLDLSPRAELTLYCAREAQILAEQVGPAIARGDTVLLDRSVLTAVVLGTYGRGLPRDECEAVARLASGGLEPDVTIILDVHPRTSRIRKRLGRVREPATRDPGRKGLSGSGLKERVWAGYREIAHERGYPLFHTERAEPNSVAERVVAAVTTGARPSDLEAPNESTPRWQVPGDWTLERALGELPEDLAIYMMRGLIRGRELRREAASREPALVAWSLDSEDPLRAELARAWPMHALPGWIRRPLGGPNDLRAQLAGEAAGAVARSLRHLSDEAADQLRQSLVDAAPGEVVESLCGREDPFAVQLRERLWNKATAAQAARSIARCQGEAAWGLRRGLFERDPAMAIRSLRGLDDPETQALLTRYAGLAPKPTLRAITGNGSSFAHDLRRELRETGREVVDSLGLLDDETSMALREETVESWPSTVLGSLARVAPSPRVSALLEQCQRFGAGDLHVLRRMAAREERDQRPEWKRREDFDTDVMEE